MNIGSPNESMIVTGLDLSQSVAVRHSDGLEVFDLDILFKIRGCCARQFDTAVELAQNFDGLQVTFRYGRKLFLTFLIGQSKNSIKNPSKKLKE